MHIVLHFHFIVWHHDYVYHSIVIILNKKTQKSIVYIFEYKN